MIQAIIFSKDRAAQLDLLLRSLKIRAWSFYPLMVIYKTSSQAYEDGYTRLRLDHPEVRLIREQILWCDVEQTLTMDSSTCVSFFCDDDLILRPVLYSPEGILSYHTEALCFSLRLGENTTDCYPMRRSQRTPIFSTGLVGMRLWEWRDADGDWGYPGSLDGHVFRRNTLLELLSGLEYTNPNQLEEWFNRACQGRTEPLMVCCQRSLLTGIPINRVNDTHPNRFGEEHLLTPEFLNTAYLAGERLRLIEGVEANAAHTELPLVLA